MSYINPSVEIIRNAKVAGADMPQHVSAFLAEGLAAAFGGSPLSPPGPCVAAPKPATCRHAIAKCAGAGLVACTSCVRSLAPACAGQQWMQSAIEAGTCKAFASVEVYGALCGLKKQ